MKNLHSYILNQLSIDKSIICNLMLDDYIIWEIIFSLDTIIEKLIPLIKEEYDEQEKYIWIGKNTVIEKSAKIVGPALIGHNCQIRHNAFIRENVIIGNECVIGNSTEIKNSILFDNVLAPHFNYIGDSILGYKSHLGAGVILSNVRADRKNILLKNIDGSQVDTHKMKLGAIIGDTVEIGCNAVINPGSIIGKNTMIYPLSMVRGTIEKNHIVKQLEIIHKH